MIARRHFLALAAAAPVAAALPAISSPVAAPIDWDTWIDAARHAQDMAYNDLILFGRGVLHMPSPREGLPRCIAWFHGEAEPAGSIVFQAPATAQPYGKSLADLLNSTAPAPVEPA